MKISDYIVDFLINQGITDVFGYPGGMVTHLMDSLGKKHENIKTHILYNEQAVAFAACGFAQSSGKIGVAFATSGPGATNLITGIGNAYYDSIPTVFITGQVNTFEAKIGTRLRQKGFQETRIIPMVSEISKAAFYIDNAEEIDTILHQAFRIAQDGRKGPVLLDIPMNILRAEIEINPETTNDTDPFQSRSKENEELLEATLTHALSEAKRPCLILGNGVRTAGQVSNIRGVLRTCPMPVVSSMLAIDIIPEGHGLEGIYYGFIGAYGNRTANFVVAKSDLIVCLGTRMDVRQVGRTRSNFAPNATIIRIDIDSAELENVIRDNDLLFEMDLSDAVSVLRKTFNNGNYSYEEWLNVCQIIKKQIKYTDEMEPNRIINKLSKTIPDGYSIVSDVGQNMVWVAQSFKMKPNQRAFFSGGMGAMGYALPAAIGIYYGTKKPVLCFCGDGGLQMNIQELQFLYRENIPVKIFVLNNNALGMIRHFQEMYFDKKYYYTIENEGYSAPDFCEISKAYRISAERISNIDEISVEDINSPTPKLFDIRLKGDTYIYPKLEFGKPNQDQEPLLDRELYNYLMEL